MFLKKIYSTILTIDDVTILYNPDIEAVLMAEFSNRVSKCCYNGSYVVSADRLIRHGIVELDHSGKYANISIEMECTVINYNITEIVVAKIIAFTKVGHIYLTNEHATITVAASNFTSKYKLDDEIPVIISQVQYPVYAKHIIATAMPLRPLPDSCKITITNSESLTSEVADPLFDELAAYEDELAKIEKSDPTKFRLFAKLLRGGVKEGAKKSSTEKSLYNINNHGELKAGETVIRTSSMYYSPYYAVAPQDDSGIRLDKKKLVEIFLNQYKLELINMITLLNIKDHDKIKYIFDAYLSKDEK